ncbi:MAG TPA: hypothetical protein VF804_12175, partial [Holophagaceae bacterium]
YWDGTREATFQSQVRPNAQVYGPILWVAAQPGGLAQGLVRKVDSDVEQSFWGHPFLLSANAPVPTQAVHQVFSLRDPYPADWSRLYVTFTPLGFPLTVDGVQGSAGASITVISDSPGTAAQPLAALVSPVQHATLNGQDFFLDQSGVGTTPTLAWDPPTLGTPVCYLVQVVEVAPTQSGGISFGSPWNSQMTVFGTSVQIPPGTLMAGKAYLIQVRAMVAGQGYDPAVPGRLPLPLGFADCVSGLIRP